MVIDKVTLWKLLGHVIKVETLSGMFVTGDFEDMDDNMIWVTLYDATSIDILITDIKHIVGHDEELSLPVGRTWIM